jgi:hypothetical protein
LIVCREGAQLVEHHHETSPQNSFATGSGRGRGRGRLTHRKGASLSDAHATLDVLLDAVLCRRLLPSGGLLIFDDYWYRRLDLDAGHRPKLAVDAFVGAVSHEIAVLDVARQVFLRKK